MIDIEKTLNLRGYDPLMLSSESNRKVWANCDDCGHGRWVYMYGYRSLCRSCKQKKRFFCLQHRENISKGKLKRHDPLPDDWKINKTCDMATNKDCAMYLGCYIAESVLLKLFNNVKRMPNGNHGFDFFCNKGYKVDSKSAATGDKNDNWLFDINRNTTADYFLCIAFDNREDLNPVHLWLIPGNVLNHQISASISKSTLNKWKQYEQPLDKVTLCCNEMRGV